MTTFDVPGARLYYETQGHGPLLLLIGSPMDSTGFAALGAAMAGDYTVVTYDPRGLGHSTREKADEDITPELQADDVHRLIKTLGGGPVDFFGSSGGAVVGLALIAAHPNDVRTFVGHEPPIIELLPDKDEQRRAIQDIYDTYRTEGSRSAMFKFMKHIGVLGDGGAPAWEPTPEQLERMDAANEVFFGHLIRQTTAFMPNLKALRAAPTRIVVGAGDASRGQLANRTAVAFAEAFGTEVVEFPGDHGGFMNAEPFSRVLKRVLAEPE
jgi:pimeloyl-ACP methyl ester carboxylesterase